MKDKRESHHRSGDSTAQVKIELALRALPSAKPKSGAGIPYRFAIPGIAQQVMIMRRPSEIAAQRKAALKELDDLRVMAAKLRRLLLESAPDEKTRLTERRFWPGDLFSLDSAIAVSTLESALTQFALTTSRDAARYRTTSKSGRPVKAEAFEIGCYLYEQYERLTGEEPTRIVRDGKTSGKFQTLLRSVFDALAIEASAEAVGAKVMKKMKKKAVDKLHST